MRHEGVAKVFLADEVETHAQSKAHPRNNRSDPLFSAGSSGCGQSTSPAIRGLLNLSTEGRFLLNGEAVATPGLAERARMRYCEAGFIFRCLILFDNLAVLKTG